MALLEAGLPWRVVVRECGGLEGVGVAEMPALDFLIRRAGVAPAEVLRVFESHLAAEREATRRIELAAAAPRATMRLVGWLPAFAVVLGQLVGVGSLEVLVSQPLALVAACSGVGLLIVGRAWADRMVRRANQVSDFDWLPYLFLAACLRAGFDLRLSADLSAEALREIGREHAFLDDHLLSRVTDLSQRTGAALAELVMALSLERSQVVRQSRATRIEALSVRILIPLGVTVLPAFVLLAVVPMAFGFINNQT
ncbi:MAG: hypothetical protein ACKOWJ_01540 [Micrococcales bacterium]